MIRLMFWEEILVEFVQVYNISVQIMTFARSTLGITFATFSPP